MTEHFGLGPFGLGHRRGVGAAERDGAALHQLREPFLRGERIGEAAEQRVDVGRGGGGVGVGNAHARTA